MCVYRGGRAGGEREGRGERNNTAIFYWKKQKDFDIFDILGFGEMIQVRKKIVDAQWQRKGRGFGEGGLLRSPFCLH